MPNKIRVQLLKEFALTELPTGWALRDILLAQSNEIDIHTFLARLPIWLQLCSIEVARNDR